MDKIDAIKIQRLQSKGYLVLVENAYAATFLERYRVYQRVSLVNLKTVIVDEAGNVIGAQG